MVYLFTNITDGSSDPKDIYVGDIDGIQSIRPIKPGETIDFELYATRNQICVSHHIKIHVLEGRATVDTLGTEPDENCRVWVTGIDIGDVVVENVSIEEPIQISALVEGVETGLTATTFDDHTYLHTDPLLPNTPTIDCININAADTEVPFALPIDSKKFMVYMEEDGYGPPVNLEMAFAPGGHAITIPCGDNFAEEKVDAGAVTLYFKTAQAPRTVKVLSWSVS